MLTVTGNFYCRNSFLESFSCWPYRSSSSLFHVIFRAEQVLETGLHNPAHRVRESAAGESALALKRWQRTLLELREWLTI